MPGGRPHGSSPKSVHQYISFRMTTADARKLDAYVKRQNALRGNSYYRSDAIRAALREFLLLNRVAK